MKSIDALTNGLVDYAGLFPPAGEDMRTAVASYASYLRGPDRSALGRFVVPVTRLQEFTNAAIGPLPRDQRSAPWRLSVLVSGDVRAAGQEMLGFNRDHQPRSDIGRAIIDAAELKATSADEIEQQHRDLPQGFTTYFEIPVAGDVTPLIRSIAASGGRAKVRTGGVTSDAFPPAEALIDFLVACHRERVAFKATAGLHHPVRDEYPLTYEANSPVGRMYGFLNVFLAASFLYAGESEQTALSMLEEDDPAAFSFERDTVAWRDKRLSATQIDASRKNFAISFGSCSFREPISELAELIRRTNQVNR
ncbi:MAG: hypothetical protein ACJ8AC_00045 [Gemmatimonadaceae bacterium]